MQEKDDKQIRSVFVGNIPYDTCEDELREMFAKIGPVLSFRIVTDRDSGKPRGYGFCEFRDTETAASAIRNLNGAEFRSRTLRVDSAVNEKGRDELRAPEVPAFVPLPPGERAADRIFRTVGTMSADQLIELLQQTRTCVLNNPGESRELLLKNPQLTFALLHCCLVLKLVDENTLNSMIIKPEPGPYGYNQDAFYQENYRKDARMDSRMPQMPPVKQPHPIPAVPTLPSHPGVNIQGHPNQEHFYQANYPPNYPASYPGNIIPSNIPGSAPTINTAIPIVNPIHVSTSVGSTNLPAQIPIGAANTVPIPPNIPTGHPGQGRQQEYNQSFRQQYSDFRQQSRGDFQEYYDEYSRDFDGKMGQSNSRSQPIDEFPHQAERMTNREDMEFEQYRTGHHDQYGKEHYGKDQFSRFQQEGRGAGARRDTRQQYSSGDSRYYGSREQRGGRSGQKSDHRNPHQKGQQHFDEYSHERWDTDATHSPRQTGQNRGRQNRY